MARKDGFPTNAEILADFNCASHSVLTEAYERQFGGEKLHPGFEDKPLSSLYLTIGSTFQEPSFGRTSVLTESLAIQPIDARVGIVIDAHPTLNKLPLDIKERYQKIGAAVSEVALTKGLSIASVLPMEAVNADYMARLSNGQKVEVGTYERRQTKMNLVAAKYFAEEALAYVRSDAFSTRGEEDSRLFHDFGIELSPHLPLNGYEPREFLIEFRRMAVMEYNRCYPMSLVRSDEPEIQMIIEAVKAYVAKCLKGAEMAQKFLDQRNDYE